MTFVPPADTNHGSPPRRRTEPPSYDGRRPTTEPIRKASSIARKIGARLLHEAREALPPTVFFFLGFNFIVLTSNLLVAEYVAGFSNFMLATLGALVVGKAVLVANKTSLLRRYDRAPLIQPILFKLQVARTLFAPSQRPKIGLDVFVRDGLGPLISRPERAWRKKIAVNTANGGTARFDEADCTCPVILGTLVAN
jgi:hypothetical protein